MISLKNFKELTFLTIFTTVITGCGGGGGGGGDGGDVDVFIDGKSSNIQVVANAGADLSGSIGIDVTLDGNDSTTTGDGPLTYLWSLTTKPISSTSQLQGADTANPSLFLDAPGQYVASLVVTDQETNSTPDTVLITAYAPVADAGVNQLVPAGSTVSLNGRAIYNGSEQITYNWSIISTPPSSS